MAMNDIKALLLASFSSNHGPPSELGSNVGPNAVIGSNNTSPQAQLATAFLKELIASPQGLEKLVQLDADTQALCLKLLGNCNANINGTSVPAATASPAATTSLRSVPDTAAVLQSFPFVGNQSPLVDTLSRAQVTPPLPVAGGANQASAPNQSLYGNLSALLLAGRPAILAQPSSSDSHAQCQTLDQILSMDFKPATAISPPTQLMSPLGSTSVVSEGSSSHHRPPNREAPVGNRPAGALTNQDSTASVTPQLDDSESTKRATSTSSADREKQLAANRMYTRKCRRRKKEYEENLKKENDELRKLNQILGAAPDLIVSFDASGAIRFINDASVEFLGVTPKKLIGTSFWEVLSGDSAKRLKSAFMDSLAKRRGGAANVSLGEAMKGIMSKDRDLSSPLWTLRGSIYFHEEGAPECVCTIHHEDLGTSQDAAEPVMESTHPGPVKKRPRL